jgi:hypothetical protein
MVTTSYVNKPAYQEILDDGHPIVIITGKTIVDLLVNQLEIHTLEALKSWITRSF